MNLTPADHHESAAATTARHGFNLTELIVVLAIIAVLVSLFSPAIRSARPAARRTQCHNNIKNIALALYSYKEDYHVFPPAYTVDEYGRPLHSWRTLILPYLEQKELYKKIDLSKPWNDPANAKLGETHLRIYTCPEARCPENCTTYLALVTPESCLRPRESCDFSKIADSGKTAMLIEVDSKHAVPWMSPQDADEDLWLSFGPKSDLPHAGGSLVAFADGHVNFIQADLSADERRAMIRITRKRTDRTSVGALFMPNSPTAR